MAARVSKLSADVFLMLNVREMKLRIEARMPRSNQGFDMKLAQSIRLKLCPLPVRTARLYSSTEPKADVDMFEALETEAEKDFGFDEWLKSTRAALANSKGRHWLGKNGVSLL